MEMDSMDKPWKGLHFPIPDKAEGVFLAATACEIGDGKRLRFWVDQWLNNRSVGQIVPTLIGHTKPLNMRVTVAEALTEDSWVNMIKGTPSLQAIMEYLTLWDATRGVELYI
jgi:hypothetical protein